MEYIEIINNIMDKINYIRIEEFKKYNIEYEEKIIEKKLLNEDLLDLKNFKNKIIKKALLDKNKPSNINKKEYPSSSDCINILEDDIFSNEFDENPPEEDKLDIETMDREKKIELINEYIQRKNIILKKYINISKMYQQITKIGFIKKLENGMYIININDTKVKKNKNLFLNKK